MSPTNLAAPSNALATTTALVVQQQKEWGEILTSWETKNRYLVTTEDGNSLYEAGEVGTGWLSRNFLKNRRPFTIEIRNSTGDLAYKLVRPWRWFFSGATVLDAGEQALARVEQRFKVFSRLYSIYGPDGTEIAELRGPFFKPWTFQLLVGGVEVGSIKKKWSGLLKESFSDADNFRVELGSSMEPSLRPVILATTFFIDFLHFENSQ
jgi:uncharacterized protein YxjI